MNVREKETNLILWIAVTCCLNNGRKKLSKVINCETQVKLKAVSIKMGSHLYVFLSSPIKSTL